MKRTAVIMLALYFALSFYSCALRNAELPVTSRNTFVPPTSPDLVTVNLQFSVIEKDINNYIACFVDTNYSLRRYTYTPDVVSGIQYPTLFRFWNLSSEKTYFTSLLSLTDPTSASNLFFSNSELNSFGDTAFFDADIFCMLTTRKILLQKHSKEKSV